MAKLVISCNTRPGNAEMGALTTLVGAIFGLDKALEYFEDGLRLELDGDEGPLNDVLRGINEGWPTKARHQEVALGLYPGGLDVCQRIIQHRLRSIIASAEIIGS